MALNPRGNVLLTVDESGHVILANFPRRVALHHFSVNGVVSALAFSPSGRYFSIGRGRFVEVWHTPSTPVSASEEGLEFAPFIRHHVHAGHHDTVQSIEWSNDSRFFLSASKDLTARVWSVNTEEQFVPTTLAGHRESLLGAWFSSDQEAVTGAFNMRNAYLIGTLDLHCQPGRRFVPLGVCWKTASERRCRGCRRRVFECTLEDSRAPFLYAECEDDLRSLPLRVQPPRCRLRQWCFRVV